MKRIISLLAILAFAFSGLMASATSASAATTQYRAITKYQNINSTHRFGAYFQMQYSGTNYDLIRPYYASTWTEVKNSSGVWNRVRFCTNQTLDVGASANGVNVGANHGSATAYEAIVFATSYRNRYSNAIEMAAGYSGRTPCSDPYYDPRSLKVYDWEFPVL